MYVATYDPNSVLYTIRKYCTQLEDAPCVRKYCRRRISSPRMWHKRDTCSSMCPGVHIAARRVDDAMLTDSNK